MSKLKQKYHAYKNISRIKNNYNMTINVKRSEQCIVY